jgi:hypothetical protein
MAEPASNRTRLGEPGRAQSGVCRAVGPNQCAECGRDIVATAAGRSTRRYCSRACQQRAYRRDHAAEYNARRRDRRTERRHARIDSVPLAPETEAMIEESRAALARGEGISTEELLKRLGLPPLA